MKKIIALILTLTLFLSFSTVAMAIDSSGLKEQDILDLAHKYGVNVRIDETKRTDMTYIVMNEDELIELFENVSQSRNTTYNYPEIVIEPGNPTRAEASYTFSKWVPLQYYSYLAFIHQIAVWRNVQFDYNYSYPAGGVPKFTGYRNVTSWLSGVAINGWTQVGSSVNFYTTVNPLDTAEVSVTGYAYLGIEYEGINLSVQMPSETWNFSLRLVPS